MRSITVLDKNPEMTKLLRLILEPSFRVHSFCDQDQFFEILEQGLEADLILTELDLDPNEQTVTWLKNIRAKVGRTPLLVISKSEVSEQVAELLNGTIDDYFTKPFNNTELVAKCKFFADRFNQIECEPVGMTVTHNRVKSEPLTSKEFRLLSLLIRTPELQALVQEVSREIWGAKVADQTMHTLLSRLRPKLKPLDLRIDMMKKGLIKVHRTEVTP